MGIFKKLGRKTIGVWAGDENNFQFVDALIEKLSSKYKVKKFDYAGDVERLRGQMKEVDLGWFEWGNGPIVPASNSGIKIPIINRIHRYELYSESPRHVNWPAVDRLIFSSPSMILKFKSKFVNESSQVTSTLVPIGVDTDIFKFHDKPVTKQIIYVGRIHPHKNPSILLQIFAKIVKSDPEYRLKIIGGFSDELFEEYFYDQIKKLGIEKNIIFTGKLTHSEMVSHLQQADFFLITSIIEGLSQASLEAMACGVRPVIFNYYGSEVAYPRSCIYSTVDEAVDMILEPKISRVESRKIIEDEYRLIDSEFRITEIVEELLKK